MTTTAHHANLIIGGGSAGIGLAARLRRAGQEATVLEPSDTHWYQPLWTLVGAGHKDVEASRRPMAKVMPKGVTWVRGAAEAIDPDERLVHTADGRALAYDRLVVAPGLQLDIDRLPGLAETLGHGGVSTNYRHDLAPRTWDYIRNLRSGTAVFTMPVDPIKCAGAPQKIAYLAADHWRREGVLDAIDVHLVLPTPAMFGIPEFSDRLVEVAANYGINVHLSAEVTQIDPDAREVTITPLDGRDKFSLTYDMMHVTPHQSAPDWVKQSPLSTGLPTGYVEVDKHTLQHVRHPEVFALGDAGSTPNSKTGAAARKQAVVVAQNLQDVAAGRTPSKEYHGYASCPIVTGKGKCVIAEFDYDLNRTPTFPVIDMTKERFDMWVLKAHLLPHLYWHGMLRGLL